MSKPAGNEDERENVVDSEHDTSPPPPKIKRVGWAEMQDNQKHLDMVRCQESEQTDSDFSAGDGRKRSKTDGNDSDGSDKSDGSDGSDESIGSDKSDGSAESDDGSIESYKSDGGVESNGSNKSVESGRSYGSDESGSPPAESDRLTPVQQFSFNDSDSSDEMTQSGLGDKDLLKDVENITDSSNSSASPLEHINCDVSNDLHERTDSPPNVAKPSESVSEPVGFTNIHCITAKSVFFYIISRSPVFLEKVFLVIICLNYNIINRN